jgi:membrane protease YdiL (CAAX protease family)
MARIPFSLFDVIIVFLVVTVLFLLADLRIWRVDLLISSLSLPMSMRVLLLFLLQEMILLIPLAILIYGRYKQSFFKTLSFKRTPLIKSIGSVLFWYMCYILFSTILFMVLDRLGWNLPGYGEGQNILPFFGQDPYTMLVMLLVIVIIAPVTEELFFRGFVFMTFWEKSNYFIATLCTSLIFASVHFDFNAFLPRFLLGLILNHLVVSNDKSIVPSLMFHMMNNAIALAVQLTFLR